MSVRGILRCSPALLLVGTAIAASPAHADDWEWAFTPYIWATDIGIDVAVNDNDVASDDLAFDDLLDKIDFALLMHLEAQRDKVGLFADLVFMDLGSKQTNAARPPLPGGTEVKSDVTTTLIELGGFYRPSGDSHGLDILYGVRLTDLEVKLDITFPGPLGMTEQLDGSDSFTDGFAGLRFSAPIGENWSFVLRGDLATGDTELTTNAIGLFGYSFGENNKYRAMFGYRYMKMEIEDSSDGSKVNVDMTMAGPLAGVAFRF